MNNPDLPISQTYNKYIQDFNDKKLQALWWANTYFGFNFFPFILNITQIWTFFFFFLPGLAQLVVPIMLLDLIEIGPIKKIDHV